jgi:hypothetical protein
LLLKEQGRRQRFKKFMHLLSEKSTKTSKIFGVVTRLHRLSFFVALKFSGIGHKEFGKTYLRHLSQ